MSHEIESLFYYGETPWHKLGKSVDHALTASEAIVAGGLDWDVETASIFQNFKGNRVKIDNKVAIRRATDGKVLGIMTPKYTPVQNKSAFNFFDDVVGTGEAKYHTAGSLFEGKRVWILAKLNVNGPISVKGDAVDKYLLLVNSHDGGSLLRMYFTPIRVVCNNTLMMAESGTKHAETFYAMHKGNIQNKMDRAREILGMSTKYFDTFAEQANYLASHMLPAPEMPKLLVAAFGTSGAKKADDMDTIDFSKQRERVMVEVTRLFEGAGKGLDMPEIKGTRWSAYNAITEYCDYEKKFRGKQAEDNRLAATWFGQSIQIKQRAWNYLLQ